MLKALPLIAVAAALAWTADAKAESPLKLLVWINSDKGYTGLQKVGDAFTKRSGVAVTVEHPVDAPEKFQQSAGAGKGRCSLAASPSNWVMKRARSSFKGFRSAVTALSRPAAVLRRAAERVAAAAA